MNPFIFITLTIIDWYSWALIIMVIMSWLISLKVLNAHSPVVHSIYHFLLTITEPALRPIRRLFSNRSGYDFSPIILFFILMFITKSIEYYLVKSAAI